MSLGPLHVGDGLRTQTRTSTNSLELCCPEMSKDLSISIQHLMDLCSRDESVSSSQMGDFKNTTMQMNKYSRLGRRVRKHCMAMRLLLAIAVASLVEMMMMCVPYADAAFTPNSRSELQGDGEGSLGVFGCVGSCGSSLLQGRGDSFPICISKTGNWASGTGKPCSNADTDVPTGQGIGKYGIIGSWDVSKINNMENSKCIQSMLPSFS